MSQPPAVPEPSLPEVETPSPPASLSGTKFQEAVPKRQDVNWAAHAPALPPHSPPSLLMGGRVDPSGQQALQGPPRGSSLVSP